MRKPTPSPPPSGPLSAPTWSWIATPGWDRGALPTPLTAFLLFLAVPLLLVRPGAWPAALAFDLLVAAAWVADFLRAPGPGAVAAERRVREPLSAFAPNRVELEIESRWDRPLDLRLADAPPASFDSTGHRVRIRLAPRGRLRLAYRVSPRQRGEAAFGDLHLRAAGPWRLAARQWRLPLARTVRVFPDLQALAGAEGAGAAAAGAAARTGHVEGREFASLRPYLPGDDVRMVDWKATARRGAPVVREFVPERHQTLWLLLDCGRHLAARLADGRTKLDRAVDAALALGRAAAARGDRVGCLLFGAEVDEVVAPGHGTSQLGPLAEALVRARARVEESDYAAAFDVLSARQARRALVVIFTDLVDPDTSALLLARAAALRGRHLPWVVAVADSAIADAARAVPDGAEAAYARIAAERILMERDLAAARLAASGVKVLSVAAADLVAAVVAGYLDVKARGRL